MKEKLRTLFRLFLIFFKAGTFTFAGGLAMLPVIQRDVVDKYSLLPEEEFIEYAALSQTLPGIIALNCAVFVGRKTAGTAGMLAAGFGAVFSAFFLMIAAAVLLQFIPQDGPFAGAMRGIRAAAAALVLSAAFSVGKHSIKNRFTVVIMLVSFALALVWKPAALPVILAAGLAGILMERRKTHGGKDAKP